jgi:hypothetical protein
MLIILFHIAIPVTTQNVSVFCNNNSYYYRAEALRIMYTESHLFHNIYHIEFCSAVVKGIRSHVKVKVKVAI